VRGAALLLGVALLAGGACKRAPTAAAPPAPPRPALGDVSVKILTPPEETPARLDESLLAVELRAALESTHVFERGAAAAAPGLPVTRVRAQVLLQGAEVEERAVARARVHLWLETRPSDAPGAVNEQLDGGGERDYWAPRKVKPRPGVVPPDPTAEFHTVVRGLMNNLLDEWAARHHLATGSPAELRAATKADAGELRLAAINAIGDRKVTEDADALYPLLDDPDEVTRDAALGALIRLGDRHAVSVLTKNRSLRDRREMGKVIEAISRLGGEEADDYLGFVASAHDDEEIRAEAAAARERMHQRAGAK
jgi:hypothetical protein